MLYFYTVGLVHFKGRCMMETVELNSFQSTKTGSQV